MCCLLLFLVFSTISFIKSTPTLEVESVTTDSVVIKLNNDSNQTHDSYELTINPISDTGEEPKIYSDLPGSFSVQVENLTPGAKYQANLSENHTSVTTMKFVTQPTRPEVYKTGNNEVSIQFHFTNTSFFDRYWLTGRSCSSLTICRGQITANSHSSLEPGHLYQVNTSTQSLVDNMVETSLPYMGLYRTSPYPPIDVQVNNSTLSPNSFDIEWSPPGSNSLFNGYCLQYTEYNNYYQEINQYIKRSNQTTFHVTKSIEPGTTYQVTMQTVYSNDCYNNSDVTTYSVSTQPISVTTPTLPSPLPTTITTEYSVMRTESQNSSVEGPNSQNLSTTNLVITLVMTLVAVPLILVCLFGIFLYRKRKANKQSVLAYNHQKHVNSPNDYSLRLPSNPLPPPRPIETISLDISNIGRIGHDYISVITYSQYINKTTEINIEDIIVGNPIASGAFGTVRVGHLRVRKNSWQIVALKSPNNNTDENEIKSLLEEANKMKNFNHPNVLSLFGVSFQSEGHKRTPLVVLPFMSNGDLFKYLRDEHNESTVEQLLDFAIGVVKGMEYLSAQNFIHRDLAARNIMLDNDLSVKVADFGLSRALNTNLDYQSQAGGKLPIRWMSIENIEHNKYSTKSDVWSYGVLVWEIFTRCDRPYPKLNNEDILSHLKDGHRLLKPEFCPDHIYDNIVLCWTVSSEDRPTFTELKTKFQNILIQLERKNNSSAGIEASNIYYQYPALPTA